MSGVFRSIFNYFFGRGEQAEPQSESPPQATDDYGGDWSETKRGKADGDAFLDDLGDPYGESDSKKPWKTKYIESEYWECAPSENNLQSVDYQWNYGTGEFTDSIVKAVGLEKSDKEYDTREYVCPVPTITDSIVKAVGLEKSYKEYDTREDVCPAPTKDIDTSEGDDVKGSEQFFSDLKQDSEASDPLESLPILPDLTSDESDSDDELKLDDAVSGEETRKYDTKKDPEDTSGTWLCQNDGHQLSTPLPSMPDLNSPEDRVMTQLMTVIPVDKTHSLEGDPRGAETASFIVVSGTRFVTPVNQNRAIEAGKLSLMSIRNMYGVHDPVSMSSPCQNNDTSPEKSPERKTKKLMDINLHSRLDYKPNSNPLDTPPSSPMSLDSMTFSTAKSHTTGGGYGSPGPVSKAELAQSRSPSYSVRLVNPCNPGAVAASPNRKFILVKSGALNIPVGSAIKLTSALPGAVEKKDDTKKVFVTPKFSASKSMPKTNSSWPRTPHPTPKVPSSDLARVAGAYRGKLGAVASQGSFIPSKSKSPKTAVPRMISNITSRDGKRSGSHLKVQGLCPPKKTKLDARYEATPRRPLRSRIPSSVLNSPRAMRTRNPSVVYKS